MFKENMLKDEKLENVTKEPEIEKKNPLFQAKSRNSLKDQKQQKTGFNGKYLI